MATKRFCDWCGKQIFLDLARRLLPKSGVGDGYGNPVDICEGCEGDMRAGLAEESR